MQLNGYSPLIIGVHSYEFPGFTILESNTPDVPSEEIAVKVCSTLSVFEKIIFPPTDVMVFFGM